MVSKRVSARVRVACTDQANRALRRSALVGLPGSALLAFILWPASSSGALVACAGFVWIADIATFFTSRQYLARRARGETIERWRVGPVCVSLISLAWASFAVFAMPDARRVDLRSVYLLFACGVSATYVVGAAARRLYYFVSQVPLLGIVGVAFISSPDHVTRLLGWSPPIFFAVMTALHHDVHALVVRELELQDRNDEATALLSEANARLAEQALRDELTGVANRPAFVLALQRAMSSAQPGDETVGVLYFDVDRFKIVNDSLGHGAGDELLEHVARRVQRVLRSGDLLARFGGDEFTILLDHVHGKSEALLIAQRVAATFADPFKLKSRSIAVTASIGVAVNQDPADDANALVSHADAAQYRAKQAGRDRIEFFDLSLRETVQRRLDEEQQLRGAIERGEIVAWFQPEIELATGRCCGAEALARWMHPVRGMIEAGKFVPLLEETGFVLALDGRIIADSIGARMQLLGAVDDGFRIWCNISATQFAQSRSAERLTEALERTGCDPRLLGIEITESALMADLDAAAKEIEIVRAAGIRIALDDFGTGHSSLTLLQSLPLDRVKIDRSFVRNLGHDARDTTIVRNLITLADDLGLEVVAEGVETEDQRLRLIDLGCRYAQGYLWAAAMPLAQLREFVDGVPRHPVIARG